jgi:hypothetical protein
MNPLLPLKTLAMNISLEQKQFHQIMMLPLLKPIEKEYLQI